MDAQYGLEELPKQRLYLDSKELLDFIEKDCDRIMSRINEIGDAWEDEGEYNSPVLSLNQTMESFKNEYRKIERIIRMRFNGIKIKSIRFESCMDGDCGIRFGAGFFVIKY